MTTEKDMITEFKSRIGECGFAVGAGPLTYDEYKVEAVPTFSSEEERNEYIGDDRQRRIMLDFTETESAFQKLEDVSNDINEKTKRITSFYYMLEEKLRGYEFGYPFILKAEADESKDCQYRLYHTEDAEGNYYFWRLGFSKLGNNWHIVAHKYQMLYEDNNTSGRDPVLLRHIWLDDQTVRLTHASRDLRTAASHIMRDFIQKFLAQVEYNAHMVDSALQRVEKLEELILSEFTPN